MSIATLQERLEAKAEERAKGDAASYVNCVPYVKPDLRIFGGIQEADGNCVRVSWYFVQQALKHALQTTLYEQYLKEETDQLLDAVQKVSELQDQQDDA